MAQLRSGRPARASRIPAIILVALGAVPIGVTAVALLIQQALRFFDPCLQWASSGPSESRGPNGRRQFTAELSTRAPAGAKGPCGSGATAAGLTKRRALAQMILIPGCLFLASVLAVLGVFRLAPALAELAAVILLAEVLPSFSLAPLTLAEAVLCFLGAWQVRRFLRAIHRAPNQ